MKPNSEAAFQSQVTQLAGLYGWRVYHTHDSRRSAPGFPDLVLVRGAELLFAELKAAKGRVRPEQAEWIAALAVVEAAVKVAAECAVDYPGGCALPAVETHLWRPSDFDVLHERLARDRYRLEPVYRDPGAAA